MYDKNKIHSIALLVCIGCSMLSPKTDYNPNIQTVQAQQKAQTGSENQENKQGAVPVLLSDDKQDNGEKKNTGNNGPRRSNTLKVECNVDCKVQTLVSLGIEAKIAGSLVYTCKEKAKDPTHCIIAGGSIVKNESSGGKRCKNNNCFGIGGGKTKYDSLEDGVEHWVYTYNKYWYKAQSASFFYPAKGKVAPSRYCTSEYSSDSSIGCPNGNRIAQDFWNKLENKF